MHPIPLPLAFGFGNLAILGWLSAAAAPLIIHLWMRHTHRELPWAAMRFLQAAILKHARRLQFQQWLLLAIRTAILLLIVLAAAKPFWTGWGGGANSARIHRLLVLDTSFSMGYLTENGTRFNHAQQHVRELIDASHPGDIYSLCTLGNPPQVILGRAVADHNRVNAAVGNLTPTQGTADLAVTLRAIGDVLAKVESEVREVSRHEIVFLTDMGSNTWSVAIGKEGEAANPQAAEIGEILRRLADRARIRVVDVGDSETSNVAVTNIHLPREPLTTTAPIAITAEIRNFSSRQSDNLVAELLIDGLPTAESTLSISPDGSGTAKFSYQFAEAGQRGLEIRLPDDRLPVDNRRYLAADVQERARVLCVAGAPGAARYVAEALNPGLAESAAVQPRVVSESTFREIPLTDFDCVFFCDVAQFSESERDRIDRYLQLGGGVVWFLGERVLPQQYNAVLGGGAENVPPSGDRADSQPTRPPVQFASFAQATDEAASKQVAILPARLGPIVATPSYGLDPLDYRHPIVEPFRGRERAGLLTTPVSRYYRLEVPKPGDSNVALATLNGNPFIVTAPVHRGRVVLVATAGSLESVDPTTGEPWTAMPAWPSFLPLVREMFHYASAEFRRDATGLVGETISGLMATQSNSPLQVLRPNNERSPLPGEVTPDGNRWAFTSTEAAGIYQVVPAESDRAMESFSINVDPRESTLTRVDISLLPTELSIRNLADTATSSVVSLAADSRLHRVLLTAALILLLVETWLAWRFGRGTA